jgi:hypothetical protein
VPATPGSDVTVGNDSPGVSCHDSHRLRRFEQETQAVAVLNHSRILVIYDVGDYNDAPFLIRMEGESFLRGIRPRSLPQRRGDRPWGANRWPWWKIRESPSCLPSSQQMEGKEYRT